MSIDTSAAPYYDDYDDHKNFTKVLFRPDRAVQARELNQSQTILQRQISRFGDNIFKQGSVVSGCHVTSIDSLPYVKIRDAATDGSRVDVSKLTQLNVKNGANTVGVIVSSAPGFENRAPDLNTLFVRYINSGNDGSSSTFNADETLTIYNPLYQVEKIKINNGGFGFANTDTISFISAAYVQNTTGGNTFSSGIYAGDIVANGAGANVAIQSVTYSGSDTIVTFKPTSADLQSGNTAAWNITASTFTDANTGQSIVVANVIGSGASAQVITNNNGVITDSVIIATGSGYSVSPTPVVVSSTASTAQKQQVSLSAENFVQQVVVAGSVNSPIGFGFGVTVDEGTIYQNKTFTRTDRQFVVVDKYSQTPSDVVVGFVSSEDIVTYLDDGSLVDNAQGFPNFNAPGADRLKVTATAVVLGKAEAAQRTDFVSLVEFSEGQPYKNTDTSSYNIINDAIALRTYEQAGNFVTDQFLVTTKSPSIANEPTTLNVVVDPGVAYIDGYRVATDRNYVLSVDKGTDTQIATIAVNADYGNYVVCSAIQGTMVGVIDSVVSLYTTVPTFNPGGGQPAGSVGSARIKGIKTVNVNGITKYNVYLYDISLNAGVPFSSIVALNKTDFAATIETSVIVEPSKARSIFNIPASAVKSVSNVSYTVQKSDWGTVTANTTGYATLTLSGTDRFPVAGALNSDQLSQVILVPTVNVVSSSAQSGTVTTTASANVVTGTSTTFNTLSIGRYVSIGNSTSNSISQIVGITNATSMTVSPAPTVTYSSADVRLAVPQYQPIPLASANVDVGRTTLTANVGFAIPSTTVTALASVVVTPTAAAKTVTRSSSARLTLSTNAGGTVGPWCLGHADIIRLGGVYRGSNTTFTEASPSIVDITNDFYIDNNQTPDATGLGYLYQKATAQNAITSAHHLLVVFDVVRSSTTEVRTVSSYPINDAVVLASLPNHINTLELPEVNGTNQYYDVRDAIDFRPLAANTVAVQTNHAIAPVNPTEPAYSARYSGSVRFPAPDTTVSAAIEYYLPRNDLVVASSNGSITVVSGQPGTNQFPDQPTKSIIINKLVVPPYPSLPVALSSDMAKLADTKIASDKYANRRLAGYTVSTTLTARQISEQQPKRYRMADIGAIDRRMQAVEYSLSLSLAEAQTGKRNIPSVNDQDTDRFKFGFFVDSFADAVRTDTINPQYTATIVNNVVQPRTLEYVVAMTPDGAEASSGGAVTLPYTNETLVSQLGATDGPIIVAPPVEPEPPVVIPNEPEVVEPPVLPPPTTTANVTVNRQQIIKYLFKDRTSSRSGKGRVWEDWTFTLSESAGPCKLYINMHDNQNAIEIFQANSPSEIPMDGKQTLTKLLRDGHAFQHCTSLEKAELQGRLNVKGRAFEESGRIGNLGDSPYRKYAVEDLGKIVWDHDPAGGRHYLIRVTKYDDSGDGNTKGMYICEFQYPADYTVTVTVPNVPLTIDYNGRFTDVQPNRFDVGSFTDATLQTFYIPAQAFNIVATGLKPGTNHTFNFDGTDRSSKCQPVGGNLGDTLRSGADGSLAFTFYYDANTATPTSEFEQANLIANATVSAKVMTLWDSDKSFASGFIETKPYVSTWTPATTTSPYTTGLPAWKAEMVGLNQEERV